ncbi:MAG: UvrD-helicase domain-containing protein [Bacteroidetes bacterium]|nr:UvrD-helicase domain-containing protein [Bacteroidota bacterium]
MIIDEQIRSTIRGDREFLTPLSSDSSFSLDENFLVRAGAGSGKTSVLIERMVALVRCGVPVDHLAAITFTRKAAGEMRGRFFEALEDAESKLDPAGRLDIDDFLVSTAFSEELKHVSRARSATDGPFIDTIHAFCSSLLRERPFSFGLSPDFKIVDERQERILRRQFWNQYLRLTLTAELNWRKEFGDLGILPSDLFDYFGDRASLMHLIVESRGVEQPDLAGAMNKTEKYLGWIGERMPFSEGVDKISGLVIELARFRRVRGTNTNADRAVFLEKLNSLVGRDGSLSSGVVAVTKWSRTKSDPARQTANALKGSSLLDGEDKSISSFVTSVVRPAVTAWRQFVHSKIEEFVDSATKAYRQYRVEQGRLTYDDLLLMVVEAMRDDPGLREYVQGRYSHILVDEFQDTDPLQSQIIFLITSRNIKERDWKKCRPRPGSLFMVGDEKQSIYRFRHADIRVFGEIAGQIELSGGRSLHLQTNFRSRPELCAWINSAVEPLFAMHDETYQAEYESLSAANNERMDTPPVMQLRIDQVAGNNATGIAIKDAAALAGLIRSAVDGDADADLNLSGVRFGDFLILVRASNRMHIYAAALENQGIPYVTAGGKAINHSGALAPLIDLIDTVYNANDPVARLAYLRGPFAGLSDAVLYRFVQAGGDYLNQPELPESLSGEEKAAFMDAFGTLTQARELFEENSLSHALEQLISRRGLMAAFVFDEGGSARAGAVQRTLSLMRTWESTGLGWPEIRVELHRLLNGEIEAEEMTLETGTKDVVRLYNVHQAKGLEARVVCLADPLPKENFSDPRIHIDRSEAGDRLFLPARKRVGYREQTIAEPLGWLDALGEELIHEQAERTRLLYVAATRAREVLVVSRYLGKEDAGTWSPLYAALDDTDAPSILSEAQDAPQASPDHSSGSRSISSDEWFERLSFAQQQLEKIAKPSYEVVSVTGIEKATEADDVAEIGAGARAVAPPGRGMGFGNAMHRLLEYTVQHRTTPRTVEEERNRVITVLDEECETGRVSDNQLADAALSQLSDFRESVVWNHLLVADQVLTEVPFSVSSIENEKREILTGTIDLVFCRDDAWTIVDYKTDRTDAESLRDKYAGQVLAYSRAWKTLADSPVVECGLWSTHEGCWIPVT